MIRKIAGYIVGAILVVVLAQQYWLRYHLPMPDAPSVVVLPARLSPSPTFFSDAIPGFLSTHLSGVPGMDIKAPPTSLEFADIGGDVRRASLAYSANVVVLPELKGNADNFQLDLQAIDPVTQSVIWHGSFAGSRSKYLEMMQQAGEALRHAIRPSSKAVTPVAVVGGSEAELAMKEGEYHLDRFNARHEVTDFDASLKALQRVLELNPQLADAAADISRLYGMADPVNSVEVENWARRAIAIDPRCGRGFFMLATITKDLNDSLRAATFAPEFALAHLALGQAIASSATLAFVASRQATQLDPLYLYAPLAEAGYLHQLGRTSEAFAILDRQVVGINPEMTYGRWTQTSLMIELGWLDRADPSVKNVDAELERQHPMPYALGEIRRVPTLAKNGYVDDSLAILSHAADSSAAVPYDWLILDRRVDSLRKDDRYFRIQEYSKAQFQELLKVVDQAKERGELPDYLQQPLVDLREQLKF